MASWQRLPVVRSRAGRSRASVVAALLAATVVLGGCAPAAAPKPTPTPLFTSEADAFKAAEQVYRDYVDATNARNDGDKSADPEAFLAGRALEESVALTRSQKESEITLDGHFEVASFKRDRVRLKGSDVTVIANVCVDVSGTRIHDAGDKDVTPSDRQDRALLSVQFNRSSSRLLIFQANATGQAC